jgi:hypothetical protein
MNSKIIFAFVLGAAAGSAVTWKLVKTKYERIAQEDIDSVKEYYAKKVEETKPENAEEPVENNEDCDMVETQPDMESYFSNLTSLKYGDFEEEGGTDVIENNPYVIAPDEFGDQDGYETVSLTYYADEILADDDNCIIEDVDNLVGFDSLHHFGEYEDDSVFVRNDRLETDYEILLDERLYKDVINRKEDNDD